MKVLIRAGGPVPRLNYAFSLILGGSAGDTFLFTTNNAEWMAYAGPKIWYDAAAPPANGGIWLPATGFLYETGIRAYRPDTGIQEGAPVLFPLPQANAPFLFDLPATVFFLVSRYEEYIPFNSDAHGRFPATASTAYRAGFLDFPIVDFWINRLLDRLEQAFPQEAFKRPPGRSRLTYDIDMPWAFCHKKWWQYPAGYAGNLFRRDWRQLRQRWAVQTGGMPDPFFSFPLLQTRHRELDLQPTWFFLLAGPGKYDPYSGYRSKAYGDFARDLLRQYDGGIHPSYYSTDRPELFRQELQRWQSLFGSRPQRSRQHYLRLRLPDTYRLLLEAGILEDHSMGYADLPGFRAGTSRPFRWYDLAAERETPLMVFPFVVMEVTLQQYLKLDPAAAVEQLRELYDVVKKEGADWAVLWHNSSLPPAQGWTGWDAVHDEMLNLTANF